MHHRSPSQPDDSDAQALGAVPLSQTMVPNAYGSVWCDEEHGGYWADPTAAALLDIEPDGLLSAEPVADILRHLRLGVQDAHRYHTFNGPKGGVLRARYVAAPDARKIILVDDLTDIVNRVFQLRGRQQEYRELFENAQYGIYRATVDGRYIHVNPALARLHGYPTEAAMLEGMRHVNHQCYMEPSRGQMFRQELETKGKVVDFVSEIFSHRTGERIWISETAWLVHDQAGNPRYLAGTLVDITARMKHMEGVKTAAETDALTKLSNRAAFYAELDRRIASPDGSGVIVFMMDCDRFKDINDVYGHARGDMVLRTCAERLRAALPADGLLARLGGDEFALLTSSISDTGAVLALAKQVTEAIEQPIIVEGAAHHLSVSIGIARFPDHAQTRQDLLRSADLALYSVKGAGRGHARMFDSELDHIERNRISIESDLRGAHKRQELELHYQPVVDARKMTIVGLEALIRWRHPVRGLVSPSDFIAVAEDSGLMLPFGEWAIHEACRHVAALPSYIKVAVNVSALQFRSSDLARQTARALDANGLDPARLELEITESMILRNEAATYAVLEELRALGVQIVLDDFGTGYSSLSYLQQFAFDRVKIDGSFVRSLKTNSVNRALTRAVLSIGRDLGLSVVAEGIETEDERQTLLAEGCTLQQGYFFGRPQPFVDMTTRIALENLGHAGKDSKPAASTAA